MSALDYYPTAVEVPVGLETERCLLTMLTAAHNGLDYVAVMKTAERLRARTNERWPHEGFTRDENLADLERHEQEHLERSAFTYTILDRMRSRCLGCLYLRPVESLLKRGVVSEGALPPRDYSTTVDFWVVTDPSEAYLEHELLPAVDRWISEEWAFDRWYWTTTDGDTEQAGLFRRAFSEAFVVEGRDGIVYLGFDGPIAKSIAKSPTEAGL